MNAPEPKQPQQVSVSSAQFIASAFMLSPVVLAGIGTGMVTIGGMEGGVLADGSARDIVRILFLFLGIAAIPFSFFMRRAISGGAGAARDISRAFGASFIAMGTAEAAAIFGFVIAVLTGDLMLAGILWGVGFAGMLFHWPTRRWLEGR
ncbi:MAG: hypothetical protein IT368_13090 [Candidatus Hydrogenedentes bacterium]|nr:hypothetical protein [Candidatus Hydrogenedentota bacterium]